MLKSYKVILWDFDGVIMDSMSVRDKGFEIVLSEYPNNEIEELMKYHRRNGGLSRYHKFRYFFERIRNESVSEIEISNLANKFSAVMLRNLINPDLLIPDSIGFIRDNYQKFNMHIVSGSDQAELRIICQKLKITKFFNSVNGSPTAKTDLVQKILNDNRYATADVCLIGDSINDFEAAEDNKIHFYGYRNEELRRQDMNFISSLNNLY